MAVEEEGWAKLLNEKKKTNTGMNYQMTLYAINDVRPPFQFHLRKFPTYGSINSDYQTNVFNLVVVLT